MTEAPVPTAPTLPAVDHPEVAEAVAELREAGAVAVYADPQALLDDFENSPLGRLVPAG